MPAPSSPESAALLEQRIVRFGAAIVVAALAAASLWLGFHGGGTRIEQWLPIGIVFGAGLATLAFGGALASWTREMWPSWTAVGAVIGLGLLALASVAWSAAPSLTVDAAALWFLTALAFGAATFVIRGAGAAATALTAIVAVSLIVAIGVEVHLLRGDNLFAGNRLTWPIDYANGDAALVLIGVPAAIGMASVASAPRVLRAVFSTSAGLLLGVGMLAASRGGSLALIASLVVLLVLGKPRLPSLLMSVAAISGPAVEWHGLLSGTSVASARGHAVLRAALISAVVGLVAVFLTTPLLAAWRRRRVRLVGAACIVVACGALAFALVYSIGSPFTVASHAWRQFDQSTPSTAASNAPGLHLLAAQSNRYDYWRVAWHVWKNHPLIGSGAGTFPLAWFRNRTITESVADPHGWVFRIAAEQGVVGLLFFAALLLALTVAAVRGRLGLRVNAVGAASAATAAYFIVHSSVDWLPLVASVLFLGVLAFAATLAAGVPAPTRLGGLRLHLGVGLATLLVIALFLPIWLSASDVARAESSLDPSTALGDLQAAQRLTPWDIQPYEIGAEIRYAAGDLVGARRTVDRALAMEPQRWELWQELADIEAAAGRKGQADAAERRARALNPLLGH
ncbi:MAG TPA: O-antigen ligase family protein [Gaiellaceae bacterium]|nr:O-antigen ligase family protein [Gaiellaceae bacterium]